MSGCSVWAFERNVGFTDRLLLGSFTKKMSKQRTHVCYDTFRLFFLVRGKVCICRGKIHI